MSGAKNRAKDEAVGHTESLIAAMLSVAAVVANQSDEQVIVRYKALLQRLRAVGLQ
jgi:hypothetical protein